jgi:hypothetical protein
MEHTELLIDGMRIVMQVLVDQYRLPRDTKDDIQQWFDRCYEVREGIGDQTPKYKANEHESDESV